MTGLHQVAIELLPAYSGGGLDVDQSRDVEALITDYVDGALDVDTKATFDGVMEGDPALAEEVEKARRGKDILAELFPPATDPLEDPNSPEIQQFLDELMTKKDEPVEPDDAKVVMLPAVSPPPSRTLYALAASLAIVLIGGSVWFAQNIQGRFDEAQLAQTELQQQVDQLGVERQQQQEQIAGLTDEITTLTADLDQAVAAGDDAQSSLTGAQTRLATLERDVDRLASELAEAEEARRIATTQLTDAEGTIVALRDQQAGLEQQIAGLETDVQTSEEHRQASETERAALVADVGRLQSDLATVETERDNARLTLTEADARLATLEDDLADVRTQLTTANQNERNAEAQLAEAAETLSTLRSGRTSLEQQVAELSLQAETGAAALKANRERLAAVEQELAAVQTNWTEAQQQIAQQAIDRATLDQTLAGLEDRLRWISQVAEYHQRFAQQPPRRWVEASIDRPDDLNTLLADLGSALGLDRPLPLPGVLADEGLDFMGARQLVINGMTVAQLAYKDDEGQLFAFCVMRNMSGQEKQLTPSRYGADLQLVDWNDQKYRFVVVGFEPIDELQGLAEKIQQSYASDI